MYISAKPGLMRGPMHGSLLSCNREVAWPHSTFLWGLKLAGCMHVLQSVAVLYRVNQYRYCMLQLFKFWINGPWISYTMHMHAQVRPLHSTRYCRFFLRLNIAWVCVIFIQQFYMEPYVGQRSYANRSVQTLQYSTTACPEASVTHSCVHAISNLRAAMHAITTCWKEALSKHRHRILWGAMQAREQ
jgi:hypothetical protein